MKKYLGTLFTLIFLMLFLNCVKIEKDNPLDSENKNEINNENCKILFSDNFEDRNLNEYVDITNMTVVSTSGSYRATNTAVAAGTGMTKLINTTGYTQIRVRFYYTLRGAGAAEVVQCLYSTSGTAGGWTQLGANFARGGPTLFDQYLPVEANNNANIAIKWRAATLGAGESFTIDDVQITGVTNK